MRTISGLSATGQQTFETTDYLGGTAQITMYYRLAVQAWFIDVVAGDFELYGYKLYNSPNVLFQYSGVLNFGLACAVSDGGEPFLVNDFSTGRAVLSVLSPDEMDQVADLYTTERVT